MSSVWYPEYDFPSTVKSKKNLRLSPLFALPLITMLSFMRPTVTGASFQARSLNRGDNTKGSASVPARQTEKHKAQNFELASTIAINPTLATKTSALAQMIASSLMGGLYSSFLFAES